MASSKTKLEAEKESKRLAGQLEEELNATGQDNEKEAIKAVKELQKQEDLIEKAKRDVKLEELQKARREKREYSERLCLVTRQLMGEFDIPKGFLWGSNLKKLGKNDYALVVWFKNTKGNKVAVGMRISGESKYDLNWIDRRVNDTLDLMEKIDSSYDTKTEGGVYLPN